MTIDELASFIHSPRHVGRLPVGSPVLVFDPISGKCYEIPLSGLVSGNAALVLTLGPEVQ